MRRLLFLVGLLLLAAGTVWALNGASTTGETVKNGQMSNLYVPSFTHANCGGI